MNSKATMPRRRCGHHRRHAWGCPGQGNIAKAPPGIAVPPSIQTAQHSTWGRGLWGGEQVSESGRGRSGAARRGSSRADELLGVQVVDLLGGALVVLRVGHHQALGFHCTQENDAGQLGLRATRTRNHPQQLSPPTSFAAAVETSHGQRGARSRKGKNENALLAQRRNTALFLRRGVPVFVKLWCNFA